MEQNRTTSERRSLIRRVKDRGLCLWLQAWSLGIKVKNGRFLKRQWIARSREKPTGPKRRKHGYKVLRDNLRYLMQVGVRPR
ncbi:hypothetical protein H9L39_01399 [Fusarium oxysporum f. sp. albedinis]|nr:hypothetical protein H9L39_01399 [Fusarium oxysporum f. sp. albedinis]